MRLWTRTCQACGYQSTIDLQPINRMTDAYASRKCKRCKSEAFDYGKWVNTDEDEAQ